MKKWIIKNIVDILVGVAMTIITATTLALNIYCGLYLLSFILLGLAFLFTRYKK